MGIGQKIKKLRRQKKITQYELADAIFVSKSIVEKWENDLDIPSSVNIDSLCSFFEVDQEYFNEPIPLEETIQKSKKVHRYKKNISIISFFLFFAMLLTVIVCPLLDINIFTFSIDTENVDRVECIDGYYVAVYNESICKAKRDDGSATLHGGNTSSITNYEWKHDEIYGITAYKRFLCFSKISSHETYPLISEDKTTQCGYMYVLRSANKIYYYYRRVCFISDLSRPSWFMDENISFSYNETVFEQRYRNEFVTKIDFTNGEYTLSICGTPCKFYSYEDMEKESFEIK